MLALAFGVLLFIGGFVLRHLANRREFYRRNEAGILTFQNYRSAVGFSASNTAIRWGARLAMLFGLAFVLMGWALMTDTHDPQTAERDRMNPVGTVRDEGRR